MSATLFTISQRRHRIRNRIRQYEEKYFWSQWLGSPNPDQEPISKTYISFQTFKTKMIKIYKRISGKEPRTKNAAGIPRNRTYLYIAYIGEYPTGRCNVSFFKTVYGK